MALRTTAAAASSAMSMSAARVSAPPVPISRRSSHASSLFGDSTAAGTGASNGASSPVAASSVPRLRPSPLHLTRHSLPPQRSASATQLSIPSSPVPQCESRSLSTASPLHVTRRSLPAQRSASAAQLSQPSSPVARCGSRSLSVCSASDARVSGGNVVAAAGRQEHRCRPPRDSSAVRLLLGGDGDEASVRGTSRDSTRDSEYGESITNSRRMGSVERPHLYKGDSSNMKRALSHDSGSMEAFSDAEPAFYSGKYWDVPGSPSHTKRGLRRLPSVAERMHGCERFADSRFYAWFDSDQSSLACDNGALGDHNTSESASDIGAVLPRRRPQSPSSYSILSPKPMSQSDLEILPRTVIVGDGLVAGLDDSRRRPPWSGNVLFKESDGWAPWSQPRSRGTSSDVSRSRMLVSRGLMQRPQGAPVLDRAKISDLQEKLKQLSERHENMQETLRCAGAGQSRPISRPASPVRRRLPSPLRENFSTPTEVQESPSNVSAGLPSPLMRPASPIRRRLTPAHESSPGTSAGLPSPLIRPLSPQRKKPVSPSYAGSSCPPFAADEAAPRPTCRSVGAGYKHQLGAANASCAETPAAPNAHLLARRAGLAPAVAPGRTLDFDRC